MLCLTSPQWSTRDARGGAGDNGKGEEGTGRLSLSLSLSLSFSLLPITPRAPRGEAVIDDWGRVRFCVFLRFLLSQVVVLPDQVPFASHDRTREPASRCPSLQATIA